MVLITTMPFNAVSTPAPHSPDREHRGAPRAQIRRGSGERPRGARRLGDGAEEISTYTGEVAHIVVDLACDARRIPVLILLQAVVDLAGEGRACVRCLRVDNAAPLAEEREGGAARAVAGDSLVRGLTACEVTVLLDACSSSPDSRWAGGNARGPTRRPPRRLAKGHICDVQRAQVWRGGGEHQRGASWLGE